MVGNASYCMNVIRMEEADGLSLNNNSASVKLCRSS